MVASLSSMDPIADRGEEATFAWQWGRGQDAALRQQLEAARRHLVEGQATEAARAFERILAQAPDCADAHHGLGHAARLGGDLEGAMTALRQAVRLAPDRPYQWLSLGDLHLILEQWQLAEAAYDMALESQRDLAPALYGKARVCDALGRDEEALALFEQAGRADPRWSQPPYARGHLLERLGRFDDARRCYREALERNEDHALTRAGLVDLAAAGDPVVEEAQAYVGRDTTAPEHRAIVSYALARHWDKVGDRPRAFGFAALANKARESTAGPFDAAAHEAHVDRIIRTFDARFFADRAGWGRPSDRPVFIIGMPRSGTTLTEQMLSSHSQVFGGGELEHFSLTGGDYRELLGLRADYPECMAELDEGDAIRLADAYLGHIARIDDAAPLFTNKTPLNFLKIGLIKTLLPRARFIHVHRDPRDTCLSIYFQNFAPQQRFSTSLAGLAGYYRQYRRLMAHWRGLFPEAIIDVTYESVIEAPEEQVGAMLDFLDLEWEDACLAFERNARRVDTPSLRQVRRKLYSGSAGKWRAYEDELGPLIEALAEGGCL